MGNQNCSMPCRNFCLPLIMKIYYYLAPGHALYENDWGQVSQKKVYWTNVSCKEIKCYSTFLWDLISHPYNMRNFFHSITPYKT